MFSLVLTWWCILRRREYASLSKLSGSFCFHLLSPEHATSPLRYTDWKKHAKRLIFKMLYTGELFLYFLLGVYVKTEIVEWNDELHHLYLPFCPRYEVMTMKSIYLIKINWNIFILAFFGFCTMKPLCEKQYSRGLEGEGPSLRAGVKCQLHYLPAKWTWTNWSAFLSLSFLSIK